MDQHFVSLIIKGTLNYSPYEIIITTIMDS